MLVVAWNAKWFPKQVHLSPLHVVSLSTCTGFTPHVCEQLWLKYGNAGPLRERKDLLNVLVVLKMDPTVDQLHRVLGEPRGAMEKVRECFAWLVNVVDDVKWDDRLSPLNHTSHFPYYVTFFVDHASHSEPTPQCLKN